MACEDTWMTEIFSKFRKMITSNLSLEEKNYIVFCVVEQLGDTEFLCYSKYYLSYIQLLSIIDCFQKITFYGIFFIVKKVTNPSLVFILIHS